MKLAILGDIHGNHYALEAVLNAATKNCVDRLLITGDLVGYYFWPKKVMALLKPWDKVIVRGNHEEMLSKARKDPQFLKYIDSKYGSGIQVALEELSDEELDALEELPHPLEVNIDNKRILLCHGSPWDVNQYIYPDSNQNLQQKCMSYGHNWIFTGHTHYPMNIIQDDTTIINPGSVGQPRNKKQGAHWVFLDTDTNALKFHEESYDFSLIIKECQIRHPDLPYLSEVLLRT